MLFNLYHLNFPFPLSTQKKKHFCKKWIDSQTSFSLPLSEQSLLLGSMIFFNFKATFHRHHKLADKKATFRALPKDYLRYLADNSPCTSIGSCRRYPTMVMHQFVWYRRLAYFSNLDLTWKLSKVF